MLHHKDADPKSQALFEKLFEFSPDAIVVIDSEGKIARVNGQVETMFGYRREELLGQPIEVLLPERFRPIHPRHRKNYHANPRVRAMGAGLELYARRNDGSEFPVDIMLGPLEYEGSSQVLGVIRDITERKRAEEALLLEVTNTLVSNLDVRTFYAAVSAGLRQVKAHIYSSLALYEPESKKLRLHVLATPEQPPPSEPDVLFPVEGTPAGLAFTTREPVVLNQLDTDRFAPEILQPWASLGIKSACWLLLTNQGRVLGTLMVGSEREADFSQDDIRFLSLVANQVAAALDNVLAYQKVAEMGGRLAEEKRYLEEELRTEYNFEEIVGKSPALKRVLKQVETVANTGATVLILGETGTGKELIARAVHNLSPRHERTFVKLNCAAIPTGLLESELFGHEKGAFTGAISQKIGRLELAHQGTLFLDEVGDIPLELQPKLLRALQEKEFERLGSTRTIPVDVRLIAATNRDLTQMVKDGEFRSDLYYRLKVFPITVPPLRERPGDIPILVRYFTQKHAQRMNKRINIISPETMEALSRSLWPGNVRELENFIERAVILSQGPALCPPLAELNSADEPKPTTSDTLETQERQHIIRVLRETKGVIGGPQGAAARLGLKRTTLNFKMRKLGITRQDL